MNTYLTFQLNNEFFAVPVTKVLEVLQKQNITPVPKVPDHILGIINFRGDILPVVHTRLKFRFVDETIEKQIVIVYELGSAESKRLVAATADAVKDVIEITDAEIKPVPEMGLAFDSRFVCGAVYRQDHFFLILDVEKILNDVETDVVLAHDALA
jgi:purine-binding chemotaxis protein CheW